MGTQQIAKDPVSVVTLARVLPHGLTITGVALEYDMTFEAAEVPPEVFEVHFTAHAGYFDSLSSQTRRTVLRAYTAQGADFQHEPGAGRFIVVELDERDENSSGVWTDGRYTIAHNLDDVLLVTQVEPIVLPNIVLAPQPGVTHPSSDSRRIIVDDFGADMFRAGSGVMIPYRLYTPDSSEPAPLVIALHGHGESGDDNLAQLIGNQVATAFADPQSPRQEPAFVLAPQTEQGAIDGSDGVGWWNPQWQESVIDLIDEMLDTYSQIDRRRVYLTGISMGSYGGWEILSARPELFAGALLVCGAGREELAAATLAGVPIWAFHSVDDQVVPYDAPGTDYRIFQALEHAGIPVSWSIWSANSDPHAQVTAAQRAISVAERAGSTHLFTTFAAGTTPRDPHHSWVPVYSNPAVLEWLFSQRR